MNLSKLPQLPFQAGTIKLIYGEDTMSTKPTNPTYELGTLNNLLSILRKNRQENVTNSSKDSYHFNYTNDMGKNVGVSLRKDSINIIENLPSSFRSYNDITFEITENLKGKFDELKKLCEKAK